MKINTVRIENFRSFNDETITLDDYTCFVGCNGAGKSTLQNALNVFFRQYKDSFRLPLNLLIYLKRQLMNYQHMSDMIS